MGLPGVVFQAVAATSLEESLLLLVLYGRRLAAALVICQKFVSILS